MSGWNNQAIWDIIHQHRRPAVYDETADVTAGTIGAIERTTEPMWRATPPTLTYRGVPLVWDRLQATDHVYISAEPGHYTRWMPPYDTQYEYVNWYATQPVGWSKEDWACMQVSSGL